MRLLTLFFVFLLCCILCCSTAIDGAKTRRRSSLASYSPALSAVESSSSASTLLQSSACVNPGVSLYDAIQTLPDTMIMAQFLKMDEFKHLADVIQNTDNDQRLTMLVPTDESIHHAVLVHYNITCLQSNEILDELIAQVADKSTECKKLDLMVRMTGLMAAMGKKMKAMHKQAYSTGAAASRPMKSSTSAPSQQPIKTKTDDVPSNTPCPANTPCPSTTASDTQSSGAVAQSGELSAVGRRGRKHLLCSSPALRRDALAKLCDQLGIRQEDFNLTFSSLHIHAATDNFLYSIIQGQYTTNQFKATNILPTLLDDPAIVRLNATANTKQMIFIQQSDTNPSRYQVVFDIPSPEHTWYSTIIRPNLAASNGVLHLIDAPIQTPMNPIFHLAHAKFDNFLSMALESGLAPMLANKPGTTIFVPVESANKLIKNAFGFESNEAKFQSMLKNELVSQLNDIISMAKVNQYAMNYLSTMGGQQAVMADKPLSLKILQKARANLMEADSLLNKMEKHSILSNKFGEMHRNEQKAKGVMAANPWVSGGPMAWDPNQWNYQQNIDQIRQAAQNFIARCLQQFGQEGQPPININPRSSTGVIPDSPDTAPQRFGYAAKSDGAARGVLGSGLAAQSKPMQRRRFGMRMKSKDDKSIEVPMKGWEYRLNRPSLLNDPVLTAVEHLFTHEKLLSQSLFDNWNKTQTYADFIQLHTFDGVLYTTNFQDGLSVESMQGQSFTITNASDAGSGTAIWKIDQSTIIFPNIITSNGVIHIIDQPLGIDLLPTHILKQLMHQSPSLRTSLTEKQINRGLLGLLGPCPSPALKALKAKAFPARKQKPLTALPIKSSADQDYDDFDDDDDDDDDFLDDFDDDLQYMIPSSLTDDQQSTIITIRHITEIIAKLAPRRGDEMINGCGEELIKTPKEAAPTTDTFGMAKPATPISPIAAKPTTTTTTPTAAVSGPTISKPVTTITAKPRIGETAPAPMKIAATADQLNCPPNDQVCVVNDPLLYSSPKPICYNNRTHVCVNDSFLCPTHAPNVCGRACYHQAIYSCRYSDTDPYGVRLILKAPYEVGIKKLKPSAVAPAPVSSVQPILDALAQMKAKQTLPTAAAPQKIQQTIVSQPIVDVLTKPVSAPLIQQPVIKQTPIQQAATKTLPSTGNPIVDVLTNPSLLSTPASQQQLKSSAANQPLPLKQSVQAPLPQTTAKQSSSQPIQQPISGQVNPNKPRN